MCRFCEKFKDKDSTSLNIFDYTILETSNFVVVPTVGALVAGWVLIIAKQHYICAGELSPSLIKELEELKAKVKSIVEPIFGKLTIFEHGPAEPNLSVGCTVDHIHIHLAPLKFDLLTKTESFIKLNWIKCDSLEYTNSFYDSGLSYLYLELPNGLNYIATDEKIPSQLFRQVIAKEIGKPNEYNWRQFDQLDIVTSTIQILEDSKVSRNELVFTEV